MSSYSYVFSSSSRLKFSQSSRDPGWGSSGLIAVAALDRTLLAGLMGPSLVLRACARPLARISQFHIFHMLMHAMKIYDPMKHEK